MRPEDVSSPDRDWIQYYQPDDYYLIGREEIREFARSMKDANAAHWDEKTVAERGHRGLVAPLTFTARLAGNGMNWLLNNVLLEYDTSAFVQTDQIFTYHRPVHEGDRLSLVMGLAPIRRKAGGDTVTVHGLLVDENGQLVASLQTTAAGRRGAHAEPELAAALSDVMMGDFLPPTTTGWQEIDEVPTPPVGEWHYQPAGGIPRLEDIAIDDELPTRTVILRRGDLVNYAGISADWNPIHWSERAAGVVGLDTCVAHGMLTMGIGGSFLTAWSGDPTAIRDYRVRFTGIAYVSEDEPAEVTYMGRVKSLDHQARTATIAIGATCRGKRIFGRATAVVALR